jgi:serine/threonine protein kinase
MSRKVDLHLKRKRNDSDEQELSPSQVPVHLRHKTNIQYIVNRWLQRELNTPVTIIGRGAYGTIVKVHMDPQTADVVYKKCTQPQNPMITLNFASSRMPTSGDVILKIVQLPVSHRPMECTLRGVSREFTVHQALNYAEPIVKNSRILDVKQYIPTMYASLLDLAASAGFIMMEEVHGMTLAAYLAPLPNRSLLPEWIFEHLEKAVACLFANGYLHADLHQNNIIVDPQNKKLKIIDFGLAIKLPEDMKKIYIDQYDPNIEKFWIQQAQVFANQVVVQRAKKSKLEAALYTPNVEVLMRLKHRRPPNYSYL